MVTLRELLTPLFGTYRRALRAWPILIIVGWGFSLTIQMFIDHKVLPLSLTIAYLVDLGIVLSPSMSTLFVGWLLDNEKKNNEPIVFFWINATLLSFSTAIAIWTWFNLPLFFRVEHALRSTQLSCLALMAYLS